MKKSEMVNNILKVLKTWESSKLDKACAKSILNTIETEGMTPPSYFNNRGDYGLILRQGWELEGKSSKKKTKRS